ncbi:MAG TPA: hypothetical protein VK034_26175 [Enhygromyxa sp.]|nr:hypothetical protein [Enhygromyxa sp.]
MPRRRFSFVFAFLLALLRPTAEIALAQQPAAAARLGLEAYAMPTAAELGLVRADEPKIDRSDVERLAGRGKARAQPRASAAMR